MQPRRFPSAAGRFWPGPMNLDLSAGAGAVECAGRARTLHASCTSRWGWEQGLEACPSLRTGHPRRPNRVPADRPSGPPGLWTGRSRSVALHPASRRRSYGSIPHDSSPHRSRLSPLDLPACSGALPQVSKPAGCTTTWRIRSLDGLPIGNRRYGRFGNLRHGDMPRFGRPIRPGPGKEPPAGFSPPEKKKSPVRNPIVTKIEIV